MLLVIIFSGENDGVPDISINAQINNVREERM
jgi:hypothetical protein